MDALEFGDSATIVARCEMQLSLASDRAAIAARDILAIAPSVSASAPNPPTSVSTAVSHDLLPGVSDGTSAATSAVATFAS